ncbi:hypothetical protein GX411_04115 [Candidatus Fermentibacteria bacterium]|nr:hypothetical protein [Candidatus Fermentibacteria bacterium]
MRLLLVLIAAVFPACCEVLLSDDFDDGNADGWTELPSPGVSYTVEDGMYRLHGTWPDEILAASLNGDEAGSMSTPDYSTTVRVTAADGGFGLIARFSPFAFTGYVAYFDEVYNIVVIARIDGPSSDPVPIGMMYCDILPDTEYRVRFETSGGMLGAKIWIGDPGDEPTNWLVMVNDSTYPQAGAMGLCALDTNTGGTASIDASYDDVVVTNDVTLGLEAGTWGGIKAGFR